MPYQVTAYNVMIASPSDIISEKSIIQQIIHEWNNIHSLEQKIVLLPTCWDTHSIPDMSNSGQKIINKQILEYADLLIGIFWSKIGTPTDDDISGTV